MLSLHRHGLFDRSDELTYNYIDDTGIAYPPETAILDHESKII